MAITLTQQEIDKLHSIRGAEFGVLYENENGDIYIGRADGFMKREIQSRGEVLGTSLQTTIENIGDYSREQILALLASIEGLATKEELEAAIKQAKCFSVAMSIVL